MSTTAGPTSKRTIWALTACLAVALVLGLLAWASDSPVERVDTATTPLELPGGSHPLDPYVGFGRSTSAALRDDTVALWEAHAREQQVAACMDAAGFAYSPDPQYPEEALIRVATGLGVQPAKAAAPAAADENQKVQKALAPTDLDRYYRTLMGEDLATVQEVARSGGEVIPYESYGTGGCVGEAAEAVPSVWDARRSIESDILELNRDVGAAVAGPYSSCIQSKLGRPAANPGVVEELLMSYEPYSDPHRRTDAALNACAAVWDSGFRTAERQRIAGFVEAHQPLFDEVQQRYSGVTTRIGADQDFLQYLAQRIRPADKAATATREAGPEN